MLGAYKKSPSLKLHFEFFGTDMYVITDNTGGSFEILSITLRHPNNTTDNYDTYLR